MTLSLTAILIVIPILLLLEGFFSGSEIALLSVDKAALQKKAKAGSEGARLALFLADHPERVLSTTLLVTSCCVVLISALIAIYLLGTGREDIELISIAVTSPLVVFIGELIPKTLYQRFSSALSPWISYPVYWTFYAFYPITKTLSLYTNRLSKFVSPIEQLITGKKRTTRDKLKYMLSYGKRQSEIKADERRILKRIFQFKNAEAKHALIPLVKVDAIDLNSTTRHALELFNKHRHSRMPVYERRIDNIIGILSLSDVFPGKSMDLPIREQVKPAHFVAESQTLEDVLNSMQMENDEMSIVVDEHGGAVGILTFEDIVEEVVGEIDDEDDTDRTPLKKMDDTTWLIQARTEITEINEATDIQIPAGDYETLSGFLLQQFGRIPEARDELFFTTATGSYKFTIRHATEKHIEIVLVEKSS